MVLQKEAADRMFKNVWICMKCGAKNRGGTRGKPAKCRKCNCKDLRLKKKPKKA